MFVCPVPKISQLMIKWRRRTSHLGWFTFWHNGCQATQLSRFTLRHNGRRATQLSRLTLWHNGRRSKPVLMHEGAILTPKRNWRQCLSKIVGYQTKNIMVFYGIFWSGQWKFVMQHLIDFLTYLMNNWSGSGHPKRPETQSAAQINTAKKLKVNLKWKMKCTSRSITGKRNYNSLVNVSPKLMKNKFWTLCPENNYFSGARSKGFATFRNVSKLHPWAIATSFPFSVDILYY